MDLEEFMQQPDPPSAADLLASADRRDLRSRRTELLGRRRLHLLKVAIWLIPFIFVVGSGIALRPSILALLIVPFLLALLEFRRYRGAVAALEMLELRDAVLDPEEPGS